MFLAITDLENNDDDLTVGFYMTIPSSLRLRNNNYGLAICMNWMVLSFFTMRMLYAPAGKGIVW